MCDGCGELHYDFATITTCILYTADDSWDVFLHILIWKKLTKSE